MVNPFLLVALLGLLLAFLHIYVKWNVINSMQLTQILLVHQLFFSWGINGLLGFYGHYFLGQKIAHYIGWPPNNPFQQEVAFANLAIGIMGLCSPFLGVEFWLATTLAAAVWYWGDAYVHINDYLLNNNSAPGNTGLPLFIDIFLPLFLLILLSILLFQKNRKILK